MADSIRTPDNVRSKNSILLVVNIILGLILWFGLCSDYSWDNVWVNVIFPPIVGIIGLVSFRRNKENLTKNQKRVQTALCLPSMIGGIPYLLLMVVAVVPPFLLATLFWFDEQTSGTMIQEIKSPNGMKTAEVYFLPVGAYSGGNGRIEVHLKYKGLPFIKRDVYFARVTYVDENTHDYLSWIDDTTLYIPEKDREVKINPIEWEVPSMISVPIVLVLSLFSSA